MPHLVPPHLGTIFVEHDGSEVRARARGRTECSLGRSSQDDGAIRRDGRRRQGFVAGGSSLN